MPDASMILRSAEQFRERLKKAQNEVESLSRVVGKEHPSLKDSEWKLRAVRTEYAAQLRLLELELQSAELTLHAASEAHRRTEALLKSKAATPSQVAQRKLELEQARVRVEQLKTLYDLYRKADSADSEAKPAPPLDPAR
jgi:hypothetical protein